MRGSVAEQTYLIEIKPKPSAVPVEIRLRRLLKMLLRRLDFECISIAVKGRQDASADAKTPTALPTPQTTPRARQRASKGGRRGT